jgi:hypothetical protein
MGKAAIGSVRSELPKNQSKSVFHVARENRIASGKRLP